MIKARKPTLEAKPRTCGGQPPCDAQWSMEKAKYCLEDKQPRTPPEGICCDHRVGVGLPPVPLQLPHPLLFHIFPATLPAGLRQGRCTVGSTEGTFIDASWTGSQDCPIVWFKVRKCISQMNPRRNGPHLPLNVTRFNTSIMLWGQKFFLPTWVWKNLNWAVKTWSSKARQRGQIKAEVFSFLSAFLGFLPWRLPSGVTVIGFCLFLERRCILLLFIMFILLLKRRGSKGKYSFWHQSQFRNTNQVMKIRI